MPLPPTDPAEPTADYVGPAPELVTCLSEAAHGGQVVLSEAAWAAVQDKLPGQPRVISLGSHVLREERKAGGAGGPEGLCPTPMGWGACPTPTGWAAPGGGAPRSPARLAAPVLPEPAGGKEWDLSGDKEWDVPGVAAAPGGSQVVSVRASAVSGAGSAEAAGAAAPAGVGAEDGEEAAASALLLMEVMPALLARRNFPPPRTARMVEPGFRQAPDCQEGVAIVYVKVCGGPPPPPLPTPHAPWPLTTPLTTHPVTNGDTTSMHPPSSWDDLP